MKYALTTNVNGNRTLQVDGTSAKRVLAMATNLTDNSRMLSTPVETLVELFIGVDMERTLFGICNLKDDGHKCDHSWTVQLPKVLYNHCISLADQLEAMPSVATSQICENLTNEKLEPNGNVKYRWLDGNKTMHYVLDDEDEGLEYKKEIEFWNGWHYRQITNDWLRDGLALFMTWMAAGRPGDIQTI